MYTRYTAVAFLLLMAGCTARQGRLDLADAAGRSDGQLLERVAADCQARRGAAPMPEHAFTTDGCSLWPDGEWVACCVEHDAAYWCGGSAADRRRADATLLECIDAHGFANTGRLMYLGVHIGGIPWQPFPWRWGYGFDGVRGYEDLAAPADAP